MGLKKAFKKVRKVAAKFDLGHQLGKKLGLPDPSGDFLYGSDRALSPQEEAERQARIEQQRQESFQYQLMENERAMQQAMLDQQNTLATNKNADLNRDNLAEVVAGGSSLGLDAGTTARKKKLGAGLSTTLGIG